jgi:hypothetical protein
MQVGNEERHATMASRLKTALEQVVREVCTAQMEKLVSCQQESLQQECEADLLAETQLEGDEYFHSQRCY